ncbi:NifU family protein [Roseospirillum parvum]|uniref:Fe-S cluster biogenesis protein NfuA, 4Fe-4S-binding domain n=1 Tax=Roseospirillum parvum TaxID=83401 RepID=A0A1G7TTQ0_9PROT|nr:NifU family protein [Roseospirillum parvum]SDG38384.1 Fe-S cluster biogenesis protein NfuA, 4Fe-4S-binding domain [Roseospirillum parvum]
MFIETETTPNPASLKFLPHRPVLPGGALDFAEPAAAAASPLARALFEVEGVAGVFLGDDFITVTKQPAADWSSLKPLVLGAVMHHFTAGLPVVEEGAAGAESGGDQSDPVVAQIVELLESRVRPVVAQDGGDIVFRDFREGVVFLHMRGSCAGCPSSTATLKHGIENLLRHFIPQVKGVQAVN